jgi:hypothetical protein
LAHNLLALSLVLSEWLSQCRFESRKHLFESLRRREWPRSPRQQILVQIHVVCLSAWQLHSRGGERKGLPWTAWPLIDDLAILRKPNNMEMQVSPTVSLIRKRLERHPHFRGRCGLLQIECAGDSVVISGRLPTYYLKQLLQETVRLTPGVERIDNQIEVLWSES